MYQRLVDKDQIALDVESESDNAFDPTLLLFLAQPKEGVDPAACEKAIYEEVERLQSSPVSDGEVEKDALYEEIGRLKVELDWLKKKVGLLD